jgi:gamma-glutamyltranspeptidase / glutathione hydrolase
MSFRHLAHRRAQSLALTLLVAILAVACTSAVSPRAPGQPQSVARAPEAGAVPAQPEGATGFQDKPGWPVRRFAVAAAHPLAAEAGYTMLKEGGSALDAAVAVQMVLALVEPQSSGIGGGAFLLHWDGRHVQAWDGRETAPAASDERLFLLANGQPMPRLQAIVGGRAVGVPGAVRMLEAAHRQHGRLPWARLLQPAIELAEHGFAVGARLHGQLQAERALRGDRQAAAYFYGADGQPRPVGFVLRNPALAGVLRDIAARGSVALHEGAVARDVVSRVQGHASNPGRLALPDLAGYRVKLREPLCTDWQPHWRVCGMPPPSSGHLALMQILGILGEVSAAGSGARTASTQAPQGGVTNEVWLHRYLEASRLAFADRAQYVADPDFVQAPGAGWQSLLDPTYLRHRAALIGPRSMGVAEAGTPPGVALSWAPQADQTEHGTSHFSIVDGEGRAVAMSTSVEDAFGSRMMSDGGTGLPGGFLLNNHLTDFAFVPADAQGRAVANRLQPGKRPRSSMSPTLVFDRRDGRLQMVLGSPGGPFIIHFVAKTLIGTLDWGLDAQRAIDLPNFGNFNGPTALETGRFPAATVDALKARGHRVVDLNLTSGLQVLQRTATGWFGGADPRREGTVRGE